MNAEKTEKEKNNFKKTGTTIVGLKYKTGTILFADSRATNGPLVAQKNIQKLHKITNSIFCAGAGTAADTDRINIYASIELRKYEIKYKQKAHFSHYINLIQNKLHKYQGYIGAALIAGGVDLEGNHLYSIAPHGSIKKETYCTLGSGSYAALGILESEYKENLTEEEAISLGCKAIKAGILNDLYSGSNINLVIMRDDFSIEKRHIEVIKTEPKRQSLNKKQNYGIIEKEDIFKYVDLLN